MLTFEDFKKIDLRVAKIIKAEKVKNSDKLFKLQIDLGEEKRQLIAGIGKAYQTDDLIGEEIIVVANLEPKNIFGMESQGMLLAADINDQPVLLKPDKEILPGTKIF